MRVEDGFVRSVLHDPVRRGDERVVPDTADLAAAPCPSASIAGRAPANDMRMSPRRNNGPEPKPGPSSGFPANERVLKNDARMAIIDVYVTTLVFGDAREPVSRPESQRVDVTKIHAPPGRTKSMVLS